jgi:hypothetical protein
VVGCCEHGNNPSGSVKGRTFLVQLSDSQLVKDYALWTVISSSHE